ncbi:hypothetical protein WG66_006138 [Moniliophthora roreri]|nr:hypothetical protein WG66_006138 [Moniliophthora roreri]
MAMVSITELLSRQLSRNDDNHPNRFSLAIQDDWIALFPRYDVFSIQASSSLICYYALGSPSFGLKDWGDLVILRFRLCRNTLQDRNLPTSNFAKRNPLSFERCNQYPRDSRVLAACVSVSVPVKTYSKHPYTFAWKNVVDLPGVTLSVQELERCPWTQDLNFGGRSGEEEKLLTEKAR